MERRNCWEVKKCGREPGGEHAEKLGVCPVTVPSELNGINNGIHAGRCCWIVAGTYCDESHQGVFAEKLLDCIECDFLKEVQEQEGRNFVLHHDIPNFKPM